MGKRLKTWVACDAVLEQWRPAGGWVGSWDSDGMWELRERAESR